MTRSVSMIVLAILLAQGPTSSKLQTFKDWTIGCDNVLSCEAQSLTPDGFHKIKVSVTRDAGPTAGVEISLAVEHLKDSVIFVVDGQKLASARVQKDTAVVSGPQAMTVAAAIARGSTLELRTGDKVLGQPSLAGLSTALLAVRRGPRSRQTSWQHYAPPKLNREVLLHGHCHHKAILKMADLESLLKKNGRPVARARCRLLRNGRPVRILEEQIRRVLLHTSVQP